MPRHMARSDLRLASFSTVRTAARTAGPVQLDYSLRVKLSVGIELAIKAVGQFE